MIRALLLAILTVAFGSFMAGCVDDDGFEEAGENIDEAIDEVDDEF
jgi:hypothetical protein